MNAMLLTGIRTSLADLSFRATNPYTIRTKYLAEKKRKMNRIKINDKEKQREKF